MELIRSSLSWSNENVRRALLVSCLILAGTAKSYGQTFSFEDEPIRNVIEEFERKAVIRFLYRDALIAGKSVSFDASKSQALDAFDRSLSEFGLALNVDLARSQALIVVGQERAVFTGAIAGTVVNGYTSDRLPHATVTWRSDGDFRGVGANEAGRFVLRFDSLRNPVTVTASYVGFESATIVLDPDDMPEDLPFRLRPSVTFGSEVVISAPLLRSSLDSTWTDVIDGSRFTPLGESSVLRSLQLLPSVSTSTAMSSGLNVRGSRVDGFQILLDGISIYGQNHLFGLFDAFNSDAIQAVDFYYDITPARLQGPPGGTLSFITRSGSKRAFAGRVGLTNTSLSGTFEGPVSNGWGSWLVSARKSYMNALNWFNNEGLIETGLNVHRDDSGTRRQSLDERTLFPGSSNGSFYDLHGKLSHETSEGARFLVSAYAGGDDASHEAQRLVNVPDEGMNRVSLANVETSAGWDNVAVSIRDDRRAWGNGSSSTTVAFSHYQSRYMKDDFYYRIRPEEGNGRPILIAPFENDNSLTELKLSHQSTLVSSSSSVWNLGSSLFNYKADYDETSALRNVFTSSSRSTLLDIFGDLETTILEHVAVNAGVRTHYYTGGSFFRASPRIRATILPYSPATFSLGYSRTYQFLHRLYVENSPGSDVWVLSSEEEPPGSVDHATAGIKVVSGKALLTVDGYAKWHENLRRHQTVLRPGGIPEGSPILTPWVHDGQSRSFGLETLGQFRLSQTVLSLAYTLSESEIRQEDINDGAYFPADWDRRHQVTLRGAHDFASGLKFDWNWSISTGIPNYFSYIDPREDNRLGTYHRLDMTVSYLIASPGRAIRLGFSVFNVYDRDNVWYRSAETVLRPPNAGRPLGVQLVDVYDLGIQPSFKIEVSF
jgi:hypothetical protein